MRTTVVFDVGETLVDETVLWASWARWLQVPEFTLYGVLGGLAATDRDHQEFVPMLKPGGSFAAELTARQAAGERWELTADQLYPDVIPCLDAVKADGWTVVVGGNQPPAVQQLVEALDLPVDVVISSGGLGSAKPDPAFFHAAAAAARATAEECIHVGDRVDNDVVGARAAGMLPVHVRRGPWGILHAEDPRIDLQVNSLEQLPALLRTLRER